MWKRLLGRVFPVIAGYTASCVCKALGPTAGWWVQQPGPERRSSEPGASPLSSARPWPQDPKWPQGNTNQISHKSHWCAPGLREGCQVTQEQSTKMEGIAREVKMDGNIITSLRKEWVQAKAKELEESVGKKWMGSVAREKEEAE